MGDLKLYHTFGGGSKRQNVLTFVCLLVKLDSILLLKIFFQRSIMTSNISYKVNCTLKLP